MNIRTKTSALLLTFLLLTVHIGVAAAGNDTPFFPHLVASRGQTVEVIIPQKANPGLGKNSDPSAIVTQWKVQLTAQADTSNVLVLPTLQTTYRGTCVASISGQNIYGQTVVGYTGYLNFSYDYITASGLSAFQSKWIQQWGWYLALSWANARTSGGNAWGSFGGIFQHAISMYGSQWLTMDLYGYPSGGCGM